MEVAFLAEHAPAEALHYAATLARRQGVTADAALLGEGIIAEDSFFRALAAHLGVPFWEEEEAGETAAGADAAAHAAAGFAPLAKTPAGCNGSLRRAGRRSAA